MTLTPSEAHAILTYRKENQRRTRLTEAQLAAIYRLAVDQSSALPINEIVSRYDLSHNTVKLAVAAKGQISAYEHGREYQRESLALAISEAEWWLGQYGENSSPHESLRNVRAALEESTAKCIALQATNDQWFEDTNKKTAEIFDLKEEIKGLRSRLTLSKAASVILLICTVVATANLASGVGR